MTSNDDDLWARCRAGDADALASLYRVHAGTMYRYAFRATGDWSRAEECTSMTFLEAWRRRDATIEPGKVLAFLYGIATNVLRNERRSLRRHAHMLSRLEIDRPEPGFDDDADSRSDDAARVAAMHAQVRDLKAADRELVVLVWWQGLTYAEAADALNLPIGTVRSRLSRVRGRLARSAVPNQPNHPEPTTEDAT